MSKILDWVDKIKKRNNYDNYEFFIIFNSFPFLWKLIKDKIKLSFFSFHYFLYLNNVSPIAKNKNNHQKIL